MSSGFVSENEIAERKKNRQAEWEKVRKPDQPLEAPEESYDSRTLFERLEEQRKKKEYEYEETHKLKNMIKGLDNDEVDFLELVDKQKLQEEQRVKEEERNVLLEFKYKAASLAEKIAAERIKQEIAPVISSMNSAVASSSSSKKGSLKKLLAGAIVKKRSGETSPIEPPCKQSRKSIEDVLESETTDTSEEKSESIAKETSDPTVKETSESIAKETSESIVKKPSEIDESHHDEDGGIIYQSALCSGRYYPGYYPPSDTDTSDSDRSSDTESDNAVLNWDTDLFGRKFGERD